MLLKLHRLCTDPLLVLYPDSACQSREEVHHFAAVPRIAAKLIEVPNAYARTVDFSTVDLMCGSGRMAEPCDKTNRCVSHLPASVYDEYNLNAGASAACLLAC